MFSARISYRKLFKVFDSFPLREHFAHTQFAVANASDWKQVEKFGFGVRHWINEAIFRRVENVVFSVASFLFLAWVKIFENSQGKYASKTSMHAWWRWKTFRYCFHTLNFTSRLMLRAVQKSICKSCNFNLKVSSPWRSFRGKVPEC